MKFLKENIYYFINKVVNKNNVYMHFFLMAFIFFMSIYKFSMKFYAVYIAARIVVDTTL